MAYYAGEDDYYQEQPDNMNDHMEERLVEALSYHVQDSVNQALINALKPFAQPLKHFGQQELMGAPYLMLVRNPTSFPIWVLPGSLEKTIILCGYIGEYGSLCDAGPWL
ncbi:hypothetical protein NDU88_002499 [Pleurodeles waltl]|uniref:Uncharacterized protein n=1 Tax=Pleurodeles waltl TaxID=8319 RepID=A0AAV7W3H3_PLEWA|nr:hypothetical protein NDU88_002499 [Pleurodeles waltl]